MRRRLRRIGALVRLALLELWRRNDLFALLVLALALLVPLSLARPFGTAGATRFYDDAALLLVWGYSIFVSLGVGARLFPGEFSSRTIYPLLAKPVSRGELLAGNTVASARLISSTSSVVRASAPTVMSPRSTDFRLPLW